MRTLTTLDEIVTLVGSSREPLFVRYSRTPAADCRRGASQNHATGQAEAGLSCNPLTPAEWWPVNGRTARGWIAMQIRDYSFMLQQAPGARAWMLTGREVGRGGDNEPVVRDARPVAWIGQAAIDESCQ